MTRARSRSGGSLVELLAPLLHDPLPPARRAAHRRRRAAESFYNAALPERRRRPRAQRGVASIDDGALCVFLPEFNGPRRRAAAAHRAQEGRRLRLRRDRPGGDPLSDRAISARRASSTWSALPAAAPRDGVRHGELAGYLRRTARGGARDVRLGAGPRQEDVQDALGRERAPRELSTRPIARARRAVREKNPDLPGEIATPWPRQIGIGALKYADLSSDRIKDYVFDWDRMIAFEGNTGGYLQYAHARIRSIERRADEQASGSERSSRRSR